MVLSEPFPVRPCEVVHPDHTRSVPFGSYRLAAVQVMEGCCATPLPSFTALQ